MLPKDSTAISIKVMGKCHQLACSAEQAEDLKQAVKELAVMCDDIKQQKGGASSERTLLLASINLSYSLMMAKNEIERYQHGQEALIAKLKNTV